METTEEIREQEHNPEGSNEAASPEDAPPLTMPMRFHSIEMLGVGPFEQQRIEFPRCPSSGKAEIHIFTGINGCGKSTILRALAAAVQPEALAKRFHSKGTGSFVQFDFHSSQQQTEEVPRRLHGGFEYENYLASRWVSGGLANNGVGSNLTEMLAYFMSLNKPQKQKLSICFFAYSGARAAGITSTAPLKKEHEEITAHPLQNALDFLQPPDSTMLATWIKNKKSEAAYAQQDGDEEDAKAIALAVTKVEEIIAEIVGVEVRFTFRPSKQQVFCRMHGKDLEFDILPDGLKSIIGWVADLFMRLERVEWIDDRPLWERSFILLLDEIEIHLHPKWQREILPVVQRLFPNAQIFIATHSPFVVSSVHDAWVHTLDVQNGKAVLLETKPSFAGQSYLSAIEEIFGISSYFDVATERELQNFRDLRTKVLQGNAEYEQEFVERARMLANYGEELANIILLELKQATKLTGKSYAL